MKYGPKRRAAPSLRLNRLALWCVCDRLLADGTMGGLNVVYFYAAWFQCLCVDKGGLNDGSIFKK